MAGPQGDNPALLSRLLRVLIVEDHPADAELVAARLKQEGCRLLSEVVDSPELFRQRLEHGDYDLILSDHNLGTWSGTEALDILRQSMKDIPFIVISGSLGDEAAVEYIKRGAADCVLKDRLDRLPLAVARALRERELCRERTQALDALQESERQYRTLFESANVPILIFEPKTEKILEANQEACNTYGFAREQLIGGSLKGFTKDVPRGERQICEMLERGSYRNFETTHYRRDGTAIEIVANAAVIEYRGEKAILSINRDVTELTRAEEALRRSEERFRLLFEEAPVAYHEIDRDGVLQRVNRAECEMLGYERDEMLGRPVWDFVIPERREEVRAIVQRKLSAPYEPVPFQREWVCRDGARLTVELHENLILDAQGRVAGIRSALLDITERRRAEKALRENEQFLSSIFASIQDGLSVLDKELNIVRVNAATERWFAHAMPLIGRKCYEIYYGRSEPCEACPSRRTLETGKVVEEVRQTHGPDGKPSGWIDLHSFPLLDPVSGQPNGVIEYVRDISAQKSLEEQLLQAQKMEAIGRLAGGVAHDFNNLLMVIGGYSELIMERLAPDDPSRRAAEEIHKAGERAASLTRQLLAFSRKQVLQPRILDLNAAVANIDKMLRRVIGEDIELNVSLSPDLDPVKADPGQIEQVLMNLAVNARDAMPRGGKLSISTANADLDEDYARQHSGVKAGRYVMLAVTDNGAGMDAGTQGHIFEPFFTTKERGKGTGLGLATVYGIVQQSGGHIFVYSEVGRGTAFKVYFPRHGEAVELQPAKAEAATSGGTETILLAEDERVVRELVRDELGRRGYRVLEAGLPDEALRLAQRHKGPIDLLITDVVMPGMGGRRLAEAVLTVRPNTKVLYMSGYTDDAIVNHGVLEAGIAFLQKPFSVENLNQKVREVLEQDAAPVEAGAPKSEGNGSERYR